MQIEQGGQGSGGQDGGGQVDMNKFRVDMERSEEIENRVADGWDVGEPANTDFVNQLDPTDPRYQELLDKAEAERRVEEEGDESGQKKDRERDKDLFYAEACYVRLYGGLEKLGMMDETVAERLAKAEKDSKEDLAKKEKGIRKQFKEETEVRENFEVAARAVRERLEKRQNEIRENSVKEKKEIREQLRIDKERINQVQLQLMEDALEENLLRFRSTYPYDGRTISMLHDSMRKSINATRREDWAKDKEITAWLDSVVLDLDWGENNFKVLESVGTVLPQFYGGMGMLGWVKERFRTDAIAKFYQRTFAKKVPGLEVDRQVAPESKIEIMREEAVKFQDEAMFWKLAVAEVQQMEIGANNSIRPSLMKNENGTRILTDAEIKLIQLVFGESDQNKWVEYNGQRTPKKILNWFAMGGSLEEKEKYVATMEAMLVLGIKDEMIGASDAKVEELSNAVQEYLKARLDRWGNSRKTLKERLADVVVNSGIVMSWGHMDAGRLGWGWKYEEEYKKDERGGYLRDANGKKILDKFKRSRTGGGTTVATDIGTPMHWMDTEANNQWKNWTTGMIPPLSSEFIKEIRKRAAGWQPTAEETMRRIDASSVQKKMWDRLWKVEPGMVLDAETIEMRERLKKMVWYMETPYKGKDGKPIIVPMFFPADIKSLNFWDTIKLKPKVDKDDDNEIELSVWDEVARGGKMSEVKWEKMGDQALYRWMITISQTAKFLTVMSEPEKRATNGEQFGDFFANPGKLTELVKRVALGVRDEDEAAVLLTMGLIPMLVALKLADVNNLYSGPLAGELKKEMTQYWSERVIKWIPAFEDLAEEKGGFKGYGTMMKKMFMYYVGLMTYMGTELGEKERRREQAAYNELKNHWKDVLGVGLDNNASIRDPKLPIE
jgi:hypothetical protein